MKIDKIISASLVATLSCGFAGAFSANAAYTEGQAIERFNNVKNGYYIGDLDGKTVLAAVKLALNVKDYDGLLDFIDDGGNLRTQNMTPEQKGNLKGLLAGYGYTVTKGNEEGTYNIYNTKDGSKGISAKDLKEELSILKTGSPDIKPADIVDGGNSFVTTEKSSGGQTIADTKVDYGNVGDKNKIVQESGVYKFASEEAGVTSVQKGTTTVSLESTIKDAKQKGMSLVTIVVKEEGKDADTLTVWAFDTEKVDENVLKKVVNMAVEVRDGSTVAKGESKTGTNLLSATDVNNLRDSGRTQDKGVAKELKDSISKAGTKVIDFAAKDGDVLPSAAAVRVNIGTGKYTVYYSCAGQCFKLGTVETDSKGNVVCNLPAASQIGDFVFVPVE